MALSQPPLPRCQHLPPVLIFTDADGSEGDRDGEGYNEERGRRRRGLRLETGEKSTQKKRIGQEAG